MATSSSSSSTSGVYIDVIEDVIAKMREEFISNGGPGEGVLNELQGLWELKMMQAGAILNPTDRSVTANLTAPGALTNTVHDLNVPYNGPEEYETPTADLLFPPTPLQTPMQTPLPAQTPLPGTASSPLTVNTSYSVPTGGTPITPNGYSPAVENGTSGSQSGRPSPYMLPPTSWLNQRPHLDVNLAYEDGREETDIVAHQPLTQDFLHLTSGKRKREDFPQHYLPGGFIPQQDGAGNVTADQFRVGQGINSKAGNFISQLDGHAADPYDGFSTPNIYNYQGVTNEDYNVADTPAPPELQTPTPSMVHQSDVLGDDEDEPLNENDDDDDLDDVHQDEELYTQHIVLAQFDKVTRAKNKWKCTLKDGVMHVNNRDILFNKASGEFDF